MTSIILIYIHTLIKNIELKIYKNNLIINLAILIFILEYLRKINFLNNKLLILKKNLKELINKKKIF